MLWDIVEDTILALPKYNLHGTNRGKSLGPDLTDMPNSEILKEGILPKQSRDYLMNSFGMNNFDSGVCSNRRRVENSELVRPLDLGGDDSSGCLHHFRKYDVNLEDEEIGEETK